MKTKSYELTEIIFGTDDDNKFYNGYYVTKRFDSNSMKDFVVIDYGNDAPDCDRDVDYMDYVTMDKVLWMIDVSRCKILKGSSILTHMFYNKLKGDFYLTAGNATHIYFFKSYTKEQAVDEMIDDLIDLALGKIPPKNEKNFSDKCFDSISPERHPEVTMMY